MTRGRRSKSSFLFFDPSLSFAMLWSSSLSSSFPSLAALFCSPFLSLLFFHPQFTLIKAWIRNNRRQNKGFRQSCGINMEVRLYLFPGINCNKSKGSEEKQSSLSVSYCEKLPLFLKFFAKNVLKSCQKFHFLNILMSLCGDAVAWKLVLKLGILGSFELKSDNNKNMKIQFL